MTAAGGSKDRDVVPRWRFLEGAIETGELEPLRPSPVTSPAPVDVGEQLFAFQGDPGLYTAGDLLSAAVSAGVVLEEALPAAELVLGAPDSTPALSRLARHQARLLREEGYPWREGNWPSLGVRIANLRGNLRLHPRNALRWVDLALAHATLGLHDHALRDMNVALAVAPNNRQVIRAAARLYLLRDEPDRALRLLESARHLEDPWIAASLLSVSEVMQRQPTRTKDHRWLLERSGLEPRHLSELASEIATIELRSGNDRKAKKIMRQALVDPTENALAQAEWATVNGINIGRTPETLPPHPFEAEALQAFHGNRFGDALDNGVKWQEDQPFDPRPAAFVSFVACLGLENYPAAIAASRTGLMASPNEDILRNNLAFALACADLIEDAQQELDRIPGEISEPRHAAVISATKGLVAYRRGDAVRGSWLYSDAVARLEKLGETDLASLAALRWVLEAERRGSESQIGRVVAERLSRDSNSGIVAHWRRKVLA